MQTRSAKNFRWLVYGPLAVTAIVGFVTMICMPKWAEWWWAGGMVVAVGVAVVLTIRRMNGFRCPDCGTHIPAYVDTGGRPGAPINLYCPKCDVLWETGLHTSDD